MALPNSRDLTAAPGSQVPSALINSMQDSIISAHFHGNRPFEVHASGGQGTNAAISAANGYVLSSGAGVWWIPLRFNVGDRIRSLVVRGDDTGSSLTMQLYRISSAGVRTSVAGPSPSSGAWSNAGVLNAIEHVVLAGSLYYVHLVYSATGTEIAGVGGVYDRPVP
jgi:hypothetical protein